MARRRGQAPAEEPCRRLALADELVTVATTTGDRRALVQGHLWRIADLHELGELAAADTEMSAVARLVMEPGLTSFGWHVPLHAALRALLDGAPAAAEAHADAARASGEAAGDHAANGAAAWARVLAWDDLGVLGDRVDAVAAVLARDLSSPAWQSALALARARAGDLIEARTVLDLLARDGFVAVRRDPAWLTSAVLLASVCSVVDDADRAAMLYRLLVPSRHRFVVVGPSAGWLGSVEHHLGVLAAVQGDLVRASHHFSTAASAHDAAGAPTWAARSRAEQTIVAA